MARLYKTFSGISLNVGRADYKKSDVFSDIDGYEFKQAHYFDKGNPAVIYSFLIEGNYGNQWAKPFFTYTLDHDPQPELDQKPQKATRHVFFHHGLIPESCFEYLGVTAAETVNGRDVKWEIP
jgi:hypothetical protein